jgi:hypothetical protein
MNKKLIAVTILLLIVSFVAWFQISRAVTLPSGPALFETSLQSRISSTDTSMTLVANSLRGGQSITGYNCFTIDEGRSDSEYVCGTVSGTSVTSLERGLSFTTGTTTVVALEKAHRKGADVKITDSPSSSAFATRTTAARPIRTCSATRPARTVRLVMQPMSCAQAPT